MSIAIDRPSIFNEYAIVRSETASAPDVDRADADVVEVNVRWGRTVLGVVHVPLDQKLAVGEDDRGAIMIPSEVLGASSFTLVDRGRLCVPQGATKMENVVSEIGKAPTRFVLGEGAREMTVQVTRVAAARPLPRKSNLKKGILAIALGSFAAHAAVMTALAFSPGASLDDDTSSLDKSTQATLIQLQQNVAEKELQEQELPAAGSQTSVGGEDGGAHTGPSGQIGSSTTKSTSGAYAIKGPPLTQKEQLAAVHAMIESNTYGAIGALSSVFGATKAPVDMYSAFNEELGKDPISANGKIADDHLGDSFGYDGLGLTGMGPGGDGWTSGIGLGPIGGFGHGPGVGGPGWGACPEGMKCGNAVGGTINGLKRDPGGAGHPIDTGTEVINGYPPEVVKRIVHANFPRFRQCYESGLKKDPDLRGTVTTKFIIDQTGAVEVANLAGSTVNDPAVASCVVATFNTMSFPEPENGKALVTYPIAFDHE